MKIMHLPFLFLGGCMKIEIPDLPGNSNMEKEDSIRSIRNEEDDISPRRRAVVQGKESTRIAKTSLLELVIKKDLKTVMEETMVNVTIPYIQNLLINIVDSVARGVFLGETYYPSIGNIRSRSSSITNHVSYDRMHPKTSLGSGTKTKASQIVNSQFSYNIVTVDEYGKAQLMLDQMEEILADQGYVSIADMYECADVSCPWSYTYYGWTDISKAKIVGNGEEYWIKLPNARPIDND